MSFACGAMASCLQFNESMRAHYLRNAELYWDSLDPNFPLEFPQYGQNVIRFEWPPWLLLTGYGKDKIRLEDTADRDLDPYTIPKVARHCWIEMISPFARCVVELWATGSSMPNPDGNGTVPEKCRIYEEFTFNAVGDVTFVEAWSASIPKPVRLSTRVPGIGQPVNPIDPHDGYVWRPVAEKDPDVNALWLMIQNTITEAASLYGAMHAIHGKIATEYVDGCYYPSRDVQRHVFHNRVNGHNGP